MCGFAGIVHLDGRPVDPRVLARMGASIIHRGPDDLGHVLLGAGRALEFRDPEEIAPGATPGLAAGLAFRRLSIIDVSPAGHQPMCNEDGSIWLVYNGEFYNSTDYTDELVSRGHRFKSSTDTEVILHLYEEYGLEGTLERMNGMFALALCDLREGRMFLARDRVGIKPLYWAETGATLAFGSEVKALLESGEVPRAFDVQRTRELLSNRYLNAPHTVFRGIRKLPPGHLLELRLDRPGARESCYWSLFDRMHEPPDATSEDYRGGLIDATRARLRSDVPLGVFLSGGLDSSALCGVVRRELATELRTFSIEFGADSGVSEAWASRAVSSHLGTEHYGIELDPDPLELLPTLARHCEEPIADPALLPTFALAEFTRRHVTVALSGEGSDETNYGYGAYGLGAAGRLLRRLPASLERPTLAALAMTLRRPALGRLSRFLADPAGEHDREGFFGDDAIAALLPPELAGADAGRGAWWKERWHARSVLDARPLIHFHTWLADDLLLKVDKMSMAHSLEVRVPYLDANLLDVACNLRARDKLEGGRTKAVLRGVAEDWVPARVRERSQHGFLVPLVQAFERDPETLRGYLAPARDLFEPDAALRLLAPGGRMTHPGATRLWLLAMVGLTIREFRLSVG